MNTPSLFNAVEEIAFAPGAVLLKNFAEEDSIQLIIAVNEIIAAAPPINMQTKTGFNMSVAITNAGNVGWVSDRKGYRYSKVNPDTGSYWPEIPDVMLNLATNAAAIAGYEAFVPDACLVNVYQPRAKMGLHQDKDEQDFTQPIVSVSLGLPATFMFGGMQRTDHTQKMILQHGDVVVWGGATRLHFHGIAPIKSGEHPILGKTRINLTFRKAL